MWHDLPRIAVVTGTGTGVGKTVVTAALAYETLAQGGSVCVVKPVQTGFSGEPGSPASEGGELPDVLEVRRLVGSVGARLEVHEYVRLPLPMAPRAAAELAGVKLPPIAEHAARIAPLARDFDRVLVEGAGGVLVRLDDGGGTLADLAGLLPGAGVVVVTGLELGTLNATELTVEALERRGVDVSGLVVGIAPEAPGQIEEFNRRDLPVVTGVPLKGVMRRSLDRPVIETTVRSPTPAALIDTPSPRP